MVRVAQALHMAGAFILMPAFFLSTVAGSGSTPARSTFADARRSLRLWSRPFRRRPGLQPTPAACQPMAAALIRISCDDAFAVAHVSCVGLHRSSVRDWVFCTSSSAPFHNCLLLLCSAAVGSGCTTANRSHHEPNTHNGSSSVDHHDPHQKPINNHQN